MQNDGTPIIVLYTRYYNQNHEIYAQTDISEVYTRSGTGQGLHACHQLRLITLFVHLNYTKGRLVCWKCHDVDLYFQYLKCSYIFLYIIDTLTFLCVYHLCLWVLHIGMVATGVWLGFLSAT